MWKYWKGEAVLAALRRANGDEHPAEMVLQAKVTVAEGGWRYFEGSVQKHQGQIGQGVAPRL